MKARRLIANASYEPDQLKALGQAFDDAWARIAPSVSSRPEAVDAARLKLASIALSLVKTGNFNPRWIADAAVEAMGAQSSAPGPKTSAAAEAFGAASPARNR
jgi:hypothetical protein